jgi:hypothetical protein
MKVFLSILIISFLTISYSQSVVSPVATTYLQNTANQNAAGFSVSGFNASTTLLVTVGLVNPPAGTTLRFSTFVGVTASVGYSMTSNFTRISFTGTTANINTVLASLKVNTGNVPGNIYIAVTATENPVGYFYLPSNGHFYRPISNGATYTNARAAALATTFKGQSGYLVTITSADEDAFIFANVPQSQIWFALTDEAVEGQWRIDAGPEAGTLIKTSNGQFAGNIAGQYNNWAGGEPNNSGNEDYAVTKWNGSQWNDLPNNFSCPYVIEYGTWSDPANQTFTNFFSGFVTHQIACTAANSPAAPIGINGSRSLTGTVTLSSTTGPNITADWYLNSTGGNALSGGIGTMSYTTPSISATTTYWVQARNSTTGCISSTRTAVTATVVWPTPFTYSGTVRNSQGIGIPNISIKLLSKLKTSSVYSLFQTYTTNWAGSFSIITSLDIAAYDFQVVLEIVNLGTPSVSDINFFTTRLLTQTTSPIDYYRMNTDSNSKLTVTDIFLIYRRLNTNSWPVGVPSYRIFTQTEWEFVTTSVGNPSLIYPGTQSVILTNPPVGGSQIFYAVFTGLSN